MVSTMGARSVEVISRSLSGIYDAVSRAVHVDFYILRFERPVHERVQSLSPIRGLRAIFGELIHEFTADSIGAAAQEGTR